MIRGDFVDLTEEQLNSLEQVNVLGDLLEKYGKTDEEWERFCKENDDLLREAAEKDSDWYSSPLYGSIGLRTQAIKAGFRIVSLYPIYYQGWEMDEWGATGKKDGKYYVLETSHGGLQTPREFEVGFIQKSLMTILKVFES